MHMPEDSLMGSSGSTGSVDGEGPPDLVFAAFISSQTTRLYLNDGTAHFTDKSEQIEPAFESIGFDALLIDLDNDGDLDLFEANLWNRQRILINNGQGSLIEYKFAVPTDIGPYMDGTVMAADAAGGDVDLDGNNDVFVACSGTTPQANQDLLLLGNGNGTVKLFSPAPFPVDGGDSRHAALVDLDHDGDLDLVVVNSLSQTMVYWNQ